MAAFSYSLGGPGDLVLFGCFQGWVGGGEGKLLGDEIHGALLQARGLGWGLGLAILFAVPTLHSPWKMLCGIKSRRQK